MTTSYLDKFHRKNASVESDPIFSVTQTVASKLRDLIDKRHTGMLSIEIHMREGGIAKVFANGREEIIISR